jgi:hypothetical protein
MKVREERYPIKELVQAHESGQLLRNAEYQRGEAWSPAQKAGFVDSIFRQYPVPAIFLHERASKGLGGADSKKWEIVDGQQRLIALRDFAAGKFELLSIASDSKLRIPKAIRAIPAPWAGKVFDQLSPELREELLSTKIVVFVIASNALDDEVRDLFIRLQSGTALSRQQVRDAWPGNLGPFVESLAGKLDRRPSHRLFRDIDRRGNPTEDEDQRDAYVSDRQACAQFLKVFLARERDPNVFPSVSANELDSLYHEYTDFDTAGPSALRFKTTLDCAAEVLEAVKRLGTKAKFRRLEMTAVMMYLQDVTKNPLFKFDRTVASQLAANIIGAVRSAEPAGKKTSGSTLQQYYAWWRDSIGQSAGIYLDPVRLFTAEQKTAIFARDAGACQLCRDNVPDGEAEYDHYPIPYRDGGKTEVSNGRLVHKQCHPRGRPPTAIQLSDL